MDWQTLKAGDVVDIIAPGYGMTSAELKQTSKYLRSLGLKANIPGNLSGDDLFCSNSDTYRFRHLKQALTNSESKAIWCARGGYGSAKLLPMLAEIKPPKQQKMLIGFSDITALHIFLNQKWGWQTIHAPVLWQVIHKKVSVKSLSLLKALIFGKKKQIIIDDIKPMNAAAKKTKKIEAKIVGGNLSLVQTSLGTAWQLDTKDKILLLEDTDEKTYSYDRMLHHLKQAGLTKDAKAIILGDFNHHADEKHRIQAMLKDFAESVTVPVLKTELVGHGKNNYPVVLGASATLILGKNSSLKIESK